MIVVLVFVLFLLPHIHGAIEIPISFLTIGLLVYLAVIMLTILAGWYTYSRTEVIITDQFLIAVDQFSFFNRKISQLELHRIQDMRVDRQGFWRTIIDFGDITIETAGEDENFLLQKLAYPEEIAEDLLSRYGNRRTTSRTDTL